MSELAGRQGFEPRYRGPEPRVLPLDDLPVPVGRTVAAGNPDYSRSKGDRVKRVGPGTGTLSVRPLTARGVPLTARMLFVGLTFAARA